MSKKIDATDVREIAGKVYTSKGNMSAILEKDGHISVADLDKDEEVYSGHDQKKAAEAFNKK